MLPANSLAKPAATSHLRRDIIGEEADRLKDFKTLECREEGRHKYTRESSYVGQGLTSHQPYLNMMFTHVELQGCDISVLRIILSAE